MLSMIKYIATITLVFAFVFAPKAHAADTSDVIGALILGGILGSEIQKGKNSNGTNTVILPGGTTIITPSYKSGDEECYWVLDRNGDPVYAAPICNPNRDYNRFNWRPQYNKPYDSKRSYEEAYPCGNRWGYKCGKLIKLLKSQ